MAESTDELGDPDTNLVKNLNRSVFIVGKQVQRKSIRTIVESIKLSPNREGALAAIDKLTENDLMGILNLVYHKNSASHFNKSKHALLDASITLVFIRTLMKKWDGFNSKSSQKVITDQLLKYLKYNLNILFCKKDKVLNDLMTNDPNVNLIKEYEEGEDSFNVTKVEDEEDKDNEYDKCEEVQVECTYSQLKTLFVMDSTDEDTTILNDCEEIKLPNQLYFQLSEFSFVNIFNWSFVSVTLNTPQYKVLYRNSHLFDYKLVKFHKDYKHKVSIDANKKLLDVKGEVGGQTIITRELREYLYEIGRPETSEQKAIVCLSHVLAKCGSVLKSLMEYTILTKQMYVRYLGQLKKNKSGGPVIQCDKQKYVNGDCALNIRLQEVIQPTVKVCIIKQNLPDRTINKISLALHCTLCKVSFSDGNAEENMKRHLIIEHGQEPDWFCVECDESFSMKKITIKRWQHPCLGHRHVITMKPAEPPQVQTEEKVI